MKSPIIVGGGQLAQAFRNSEFCKPAIIFASGVANSFCDSDSEFKREFKLISSYIDLYPDIPFVYFSSCALSDKSVLEIPYYTHKLKIENYLLSRRPNCLIVRLPQVFGPIKKHPTLINYFVHKILATEVLELNINAQRYLIDVKHIPKIVELMLSGERGYNLINVANPYVYSVVDIAIDLSKILNKKMKYELVDGDSSVYSIDTSHMIKECFFRPDSFDFGANYFKDNIATYLAPASLYNKELNE
jgi:UDP-2-acetamido-2,6-beta-L-arabino-hexul-4-ose reductase